MSLLMFSQEMGSKHSDIWNALPAVIQLGFYSLSVQYSFCAPKDNQMSAYLSFSG